MSDTVDRSTSQELAEIKAQLAQLTAVVQANLAEQQRLNSRMEEQQQATAEGLRDTRERLVAVERAANEIPEIRETLSTLRAQMARYVGIGTGAAVVISTVITIALKLMG